MPRVRSSFALVATLTALAPSAHAFDWNGRTVTHELDALDGRMAIESGHPLATARAFRLAGAAADADATGETAASGLMPGFDRLMTDAWRERGFGDFWGYTLLAEGAAEAMVEVGLKAWDAAAPLVLIEEAGGRATDFEGRRAVDSGTFLASNGWLHDVVLDRLRSTGA